MKDDQYSISKISMQDIETLMALKEAAHWNQTIDDWSILLKQCKQGSWAVRYRDKVVGTAISVPYAKHFNWIGMVLVDPEHRNKGLGTMLMKAVINSTHGHYCHRLDATEKGRKLYEKLGFKEEAALIRMTSTMPAFKIENHTYTCRPFIKEDLLLIEKTDYKAFGDQRSDLLSDLLSLSPGQAWICAQGLDILGYCFARPGAKATQIGPLVAQNVEVAQTLINKVTSSRGTQPFLIDTFESKKDWNKYLINSGFSVERRFIRMQFGEMNSFGDLNLQYAISGPEWG